MYAHISDTSHSTTSSTLSFDFAQLATRPPPPAPRPLPSDTSETRSLLSSSHKTVENPLREIYFPHWRVSGPGTAKCVGRPDRPRLAVDTDVPIVSIPRLANRYGTPWRSAAPARYGPAEMNSEDMVGYLKGHRGDGEGVADPFAGSEDGDVSGLPNKDDKGPWYDVDTAEGGGKTGEEQRTRQVGIASRLRSVRSVGEIRCGENSSALGAGQSADTVTGNASARKTEC